MLESILRHPDAVYRRFIFTLIKYQPTRKTRPERHFRSLSAFPTLAADAPGNSLAPTGRISRPGGRPRCPGCPPEPPGRPPEGVSALPVPGDARGPPSTVGRAGQSESRQSRWAKVARVASLFAGKSPESLSQSRQSRWLSERKSLKSRWESRQSRWSRPRAGTCV